jgi:hypothetical protein
MPGLQDTRRGILQTQINRCTSNVTLSTRLRGYDDYLRVSDRAPQKATAASSPENPAIIAIPREA